MSWFGVHVGKHTGVFTEWRCVEPLVKGFPGAKFKKFPTKEEAIQFAETGTIASALPALPASAQCSVDAVTGVHIFTDGAYSSKTKRAGVGIAFSRPFQALAVSKPLNGVTNQYAELTAIVSALWIIKENSELVNTPLITIWTDSDYSIKCLLHYICAWRESNWITSSGSPVKYRNVIEKGAELLGCLLNVRLRHISEVGITSHQNPPVAKGLSYFVWDGNKQADELATAARK